MKTFIIVNFEAHPTNETASKNSQAALRQVPLPFERSKICKRMFVLKPFTANTTPTQAFHVKLLCLPINKELFRCVNQPPTLVTLLLIHDMAGRLFLPDKKVKMMNGT